MAPSAAVSSAASGFPCRARRLGIRMRRRVPRFRSRLPWPSDRWSAAGGGTCCQRRSYLLQGASPREPAFEQAAAAATSRHSTAGRWRQHDRRGRPDRKQHPKRDRPGANSPSLLAVRRTILSARANGPWPTRGFPDHARASGSTQQSRLGRLGQEPAPPRSTAPPPGAEMQKCTGRVSAVSGRPPARTRST